MTGNLTFWKLLSTIIFSMVIAIGTVCLDPEIPKMPLAQVVADINKMITTITINGIVFNCNLKITNELKDEERVLFVIIFPNEGNHFIGDALNKYLIQAMSIARRNGFRFEGSYYDDMAHKDAVTGLFTLEVPNTMEYSKR
jgi:hypothetical protein